MVTLASKFPNHYTCKNRVGCLNYTVITWLHASLWYTEWLYKTTYDVYIDSRNLNTLTISVKTTVPIVILVPHAPQNHAKLKQHVYILTLCSVCIHKIVQINLGHPVTLVWMSLNHPVLLAWRQVSVGDSVEVLSVLTTEVHHCLYIVW